MQPELEPLSDQERSTSTNTSSTNMQTGSDIMRKIKKSKTSKKQGNLTHKLIEIEAQEQDSEEEKEEEHILIEHKSFNCCYWIRSSFCSCYNNGIIQSDFSGNNLICCGGHIITGPLSQFSTLTLTLLLILLPLYGYYWLIHKLYYIQLNYIISYIILMFISLLLSLISLYFLFKTNFTDPGIIPRASKDNPMFGPLNEYDRFCSTCNVIRTSTAKHCSICDNCVNSFDHHCPWVGTCVAARNLRYFIGFVGFTGLHAMQIGIVCLINLFVSSLKVSTTIGLIDIVLLIYTAIISCMLLGMSGDYFFMIGNGLTLNEKIKYGHRVLTAAEQQREQESLTTQRSKFCDNICRSFCHPLYPSQVFVHN